MAEQSCEDKLQPCYSGFGGAAYKRMAGKRA